MSDFARLPAPPYYIVTFSSLRTLGDNGYDEMAVRMSELAARLPGFLGEESLRDADGFGITNSYWKDEASIVAWKRDIDHLDAQRQGREKWYERYEVRVGHIERAYGFNRLESAEIEESPR